MVAMSAWRAAGLFLACIALLSSPAHASRISDSALELREGAAGGGGGSKVQECEPTDLRVEFPTVTVDLHIPDTLRNGAIYRPLCGEAASNPEETVLVKCGWFAGKLCWTWFAGECKGKE